MADDLKDYYGVLGLKKDASAESIKQAYRRLAKQHHPDLHQAKDKAQAETRFKKINEAYEVLSDPAKRALFDEPAPQRGGGSSGPRGGRDEPFGDFGDFFETAFGGGGRQGFGKRGGQDVEAELSLSLEDSLQGGEKRFSIVVDGQERSITTHLPKQSHDGMRLRLRGQGGPARRGAPAGDLFLTIRLNPHPTYAVSGSDLETTVTAMPWDASLGGELAVPTLDGMIRIRIPPGTHAGRRLRIAGKGLGKDGGARGDLFAVVRIDIPDHPNERLQRLFHQMRDAD